MCIVVSWAVRTNVMNKKTSPIPWNHPCDREDVRALVVALGVFEKLLRDDRITLRHYLICRREFSVGLGKALSLSIDPYLGDPGETRPRDRRRTRKRSA